MRQPIKDAKGQPGRMTERQHLELLADRGSAEAIRLLEGPQIPETMLYLVAWLNELENGREYSDGFGAKPYTWQAIDAWARLAGHDPRPDEVAALFMLDAVLRHVPDGAPVEEFDGAE